MGSSNYLVEAGLAKIIDTNLSAMKTSFANAEGLLIQDINQFINYFENQFNIKISDRLIKSDCLIYINATNLQEVPKHFYDFLRHYRHTFVRSSKAWSLLINNLETEFGRGQFSTRVLPYQNVYINEDFAGRVERHGQLDIALSGDFGKKFKSYIYLPQEALFVRKDKGTFFLSNQQVDGGKPYRFNLYKQEQMQGVQTRFKINYLHNNQQQELFVEDGDTVIFEGTTPLNLNIAIELKGSGAFVFNGLEISLSRQGGDLVLNDERLYLASGEYINVYSSLQIGQKKQSDKLVIAFAGYRAWSRRFELITQLESLGCNYIVISDFRARGGGFYLDQYGSNEVSNLITDFIDRELSENNIGLENVATFGMSGGTVGALYFGSKLGVGKIILGKPIYKIGNFLNKLELATDFGERWIIELFTYLTKTTGNLIEIDEFIESRWLDDILPGALREGTLSETVAHVFSLDEDEYDGESISVLLSDLKAGGTKRVERRRESGYHSEKTAEVVEWFMNIIKDWN